MRRGHPTAWGTAYFDFAPQDGYTAPEQQIPDAWRILFITKHASADVLKGLFMSCRGGRDWVLRDAPSVKIQLKTASLGVRALKHISAAIATRGSLPLHLSVQCNEAHRLLLLMGALISCGHGVTSLSLSFSCPTGLHATSAITTTVLQDIADACPRLASLQLVGCVGVLPAPSALRQLTQLSLTLPPTTDHAAAVEMCARSIGAYAAQLSTLSITSQHTIPWPLLFSPSAPAHTLTQLTTHSTLTDQLVKSIAAGAPALKQLRVSDVRLTVGAHTGVSWGVETLQAPVRTLDTFAYLPACKTGVTVVRDTGCRAVDIGVDSAEGLDAALAEHVSDFRFHCESAELRPKRTLRAADQPAALRNALAQLGRLLAPGVAVRLLDHWAWSDELAGVVLAALPSTLTHKQRLLQDRPPRKPPAATSSTQAAAQPSSQTAAASQPACVPNSTATHAGPPTHTATAVPTQHPHTPTSTHTHAPSDTQDAPQNVPYTLRLPDELNVPLTDGLLGLILRTQPTYRHLTVRSLALQTDRCVKEWWWWWSLHVKGNLDLGMLARLPHGGGSGRVIYCGGLQLNRPLKQAEVDVLQSTNLIFCSPLAQPHIRIHWPTTTTTTTTMIAPVANTNPPNIAALPNTTTATNNPLATTHPPQTPGPLTTNNIPTQSAHIATKCAQMISALSAVNVARKVGQRPVIQLVGWRMSEVVMAALSGLPEWATEVDFTKCVDWPLDSVEYEALALYVPVSEHWPLEACEYMGLALYAPVSYLQWTFGTIPQPALSHIISAVNERRTSLGLKPLCLSLPAAITCPEALQPGSHVVVRWRAPEAGAGGPVAGAMDEDSSDPDDSDSEMDSDNDSDSGSESSESEDSDSEGWSSMSEGWSDEDTDDE